MDSKQNVGTATKTSQKQIIAYVADSTSALTVENVLVNLLKTRRKSLTERLKPLLLSLLKAQKTEWGYMALNTKEICSRVNNVSDRAFCHTVNVKKCLTEKSWSDKRGCAMVPYFQIPCQWKFQQVRHVLLRMVDERLLTTSRGRALDLKQMGKCKIVSSDSYRFYKMKEAKL